MRERTDVVGLGIAVCTADTVEFAEGFGWADREAQIPFTAETVQPVASISKTLIGICLLKAVEAGALELDGPVAAHLPFPLRHLRFPEEAITFRHLATHTSGLKDTGAYDRSYLFAQPIPPLHEDLGFGLKRVLVAKAIKRYNANTPMPLETFLRNLYVEGGEWYARSNFTRHRPGTKAEYSNNGAALAAFALQHAVEMDYRAYVRQTVLKPLGLARSGWRRAEFPAGDVAALYLSGRRLPDYELITYPDGGFLTCLRDLTILLQEVMRGDTGEGTLLSAASYRELLGGAPGGKGRAGLFWDVNEQMAGHTGGDPGVSTFAYFKRDGSRGLVILLNSSDWEISGDALEAVMAITRKY
ncbi:MAG: serine hydrolase domain-containing protein [Opitutales bacterium]